MNCKYCDSENTIQKGWRINRNNKTQKYLCRSCGKRFSEFSLLGEVARIEIEVIDDRGRHTTGEEFIWIKNKFRDRYDPRRLAYCISRCAGLRPGNSCEIKFRAFTDNTFSMIKMGQNKPSVRINKKTGVPTLYRKPRNVPLPPWLSKDLQDFCNHRLAVTRFMGGDLDINMRLFPMLKLEHLHSFFKKLRDRYGDDFPWLREVWQYERAYDKDNKLLWEMPWYRVAPHGERAMYVTAADEVCDKDHIKGAKLCGYSDLKDYMRYARHFDIQEKKKEIMEKFMAPLDGIQKTPLLVGQKRLDSF